MSSIFDDLPKTDELPVSSLSTLGEAREAEKRINVLALGGGAVSAKINQLIPKQGERAAWEITLANGAVVNVGNILGYLNKASAEMLGLISQQYSAISSTGPCGIGRHCSENTYYKVREIAARMGFAVQGGGTISEFVHDTEAIGRQTFGLPPVGSVDANFVIMFEPRNGSEAPVCNAAFLDTMIEAAGANGVRAFINARTLPKGWRAS